MRGLRLAMPLLLLVAACSGDAGTDVSAVTVPPDTLADPEEAALESSRYPIELLEPVQRIQSAVLGYELALPIVIDSTPPFAEAEAAAGAALAAVDGALSTLTGLRPPAERADTHAALVSGATEIRDALRSVLEAASGADAGALAQAEAVLATANTTFTDAVADAAAA